MADDKTVRIERIIECLPHRYPFLLIDRVVDYELGTWLTALKNVTINEPFFQGHFPNHPVMPGVLVLEALAQASGVLAQLSVEQDPDRNPLFYLVKIDKARFSRTVTPGDQLMLKVTQKRMLRKMGLYDCRAEVDGDVVASAEILCAER
ncbi:MAG: 3-hydroxyacyl-ACP dehydratase FabZ [Pseudomonadota bacterium]